jgi:probable O-glycosylation ligase (exosortase A-associated)
MIYMRDQLTEPWQRRIMLFCIIVIVFSAIGSQSRGAFLALGAVGGYFWLQSKNKISTGVIFAIIVPTIAAFLPDSWYERMNTINTYNEDSSAQGRIRAWKFAANVANHNILGGGFQLWTKSVYFQYSEGFRESMDAFVAHSIYFHVIGEHGWIGFFLFLSCFYSAWHYCGQVAKRCKGYPEQQWLIDLAKMIRISLLAYFSGGAFLSLSYLDLPWHLVAIAILLKEITTKEMQERIIKENKLKSARIGF